jgi:thiol-disulfide isomerase/thioredoxin
MRHLLSIFSLVVLLLAGCGNEAKERASKSPSETQPGASSSAPTPGTVQEVPPSPVPDLTLTTLDSTALDLRAQTGRVLLVNFWATWCAPCREEIPDLKALQKEFRDEGLRIIGVALDRKGRAVVAPFAEKLDITYPVAVDRDGAAEAAFGPLAGLPTTVLVAPDGQITHRVVGLFPVEEMRPVLEQLLASRDAAAGRT